MKVGIVKEIKNSENRVAIIPSSVKEFIRCGHEVYIECGAGIGSGFRDEEYAAAGAIMVEKAEDVWNNIDLLYKVKEILPSEYKYVREDLIIMTYIHSNAHRDETQVSAGCKMPQHSFRGYNFRQSAPQISAGSQHGRAGRQGRIPGGMLLCPVYPRRPGTSAQQRMRFRLSDNFHHRLRLYGNGSS